MKFLFSLLAFFYKGPEYFFEEFVWSHKDELCLAYRIYRDITVFGIKFRKKVATCYDLKEVVWLIKKKKYKMVWFQVSYQTG
jgi:hypothetical protein